LQKEFKSNIH